MMDCKFKIKIDTINNNEVLDQLEHRLNAKQQRFRKLQSRLAMPLRRCLNLPLRILRLTNYQ